MMARRIVSARDQVEMLAPWRTAMPRADKYTGVPEGYHFKLDPPVATLTPHGSNSWASRIMWDSSTGEVKKIDTLEPHQRQGLATHLFNETQKHVPHLHHSEDLTADGREWTKSMYDWDPEYDDPYEFPSLSEDDDGEGSFGDHDLSEEDINRHLEHARQMDQQREQKWLENINKMRGSQGQEPFDKLPDDIRKMIFESRRRTADRADDFEWQRGPNGDWQLATHTPDGNRVTIKTSPVRGEYTTAKAKKKVKVKEPKPPKRPGPLDKYRGRPPWPPMATNGTPDRNEDIFRRGDPNQIYPLMRNDATFAQQYRQWLDKQVLPAGTDVEDTDAYYPELSDLVTAARRPKHGPDRLMGVNINDTSQDYTGQIMAGDKVIETRDTKSLHPYVGRPVGILSTHDKRVPRQAILRGWAVIGEPKFYDNEADFDADYDLHRVGRDSPHHISQSSTGVKWGYPLLDVRHVDEQPVGSKGIVTRGLEQQMHLFARRETP